MADPTVQLAGRFVDLSPQPKVAVRVEQAMSELDISGLFDEHLPRLFEQVAGSGAEPAGPPFARYHKFGPDGAASSWAFL